MNIESRRNARRSSPSAVRHSPFTDTQSGIVSLERALRAITRTNQRTGHALQESKLQGLLTIGSELIGRNPTFDRQVIHGGTQILAQGKDIYAGSTHVLHGFEDLGIRLSQAQHEARLRQDMRHEL